MFFLADFEEIDTHRYTVGAKALNLFRLQRIGMPVPRFVVIPWEALKEKREGQSIGRPAHDTAFIYAITSFFKDATYFAVRSSATSEDSADHSFAGQLESFLFVPRGELLQKIELVVRSAESQRVNEYRRHHGVDTPMQLGVIVQEMVDADVSGIAFGANPVTGQADEKIINAVYGLGEGLVSGELNADQIVVRGTEVDYTPALKTRKLRFDYRNQSGTAWEEIAPENQNSQALTTGQIHRLTEILGNLGDEFRHPQDIEFALKNGELYLLQTRPITALKTAHPKNEDHYILWDNSNIIESYPGVTTPLTFSFISKSYETAYRLFSGYLGVSPDVIKRNEHVFANTLGFLNGRVYYNLKSWYLMLAMVPGYSINARFMEKMMGVKEPFDIPDSYRLSKAKAWWRIVKMAGQMLIRFFELPKKRRAFMGLVNDTIAEYKALDFAKKTAVELMHLYRNFEQKLLLEWKAPLLNDFFAMIWFGMLQKQCEQLTKEDADATRANLHNDLLCGSRDIISVEPVHRSVRIAGEIAKNKVLHELFTSNTESEIARALRDNSELAFANLKTEIDRYLNDFGERCVGELKLETVSFNQDPARFISVLKSYVESGFTNEKLSTERENQIRREAELYVAQKLENRPLARWKFHLVLRYARDLVSARENLRYERTRAFGIVRELFSYMGKRFCSEGILQNERDIFYLTKEELFAYLEGTAVTQDLRALASLRKQAFDSYKKAGPLSERFATYGAPYHRNDFFSIERIATTKGELKGIGCSPGRVTGTVTVVHDPTEISSLNGDILVTTSTDPGWVMLFPSASGIIVERGSLLSHSAIVSREMGKPCIVSVTGLLKTLKTGDRVEMDGSTGVIRLVENKQ